MIQARIILDSLHPDNITRLTTMEVTLHRFVLAEFNTHRVFCLAGDMELEFDLPSGTTNGYRRTYRMTIADFVDKWHHGARRYTTNPRRTLDVSSIQPAQVYPAADLAHMTGLKSVMNLNHACRQGRLRGVQAKPRAAWQITGADFLAWRNDTPEHSRFPIRDRLAAMNIRQLNEETGRIQTSRVVNCCVSGEKPVYVVTAGKFSVAGSIDHRIMTTQGYMRIGDLVPGETQIVVRRFGKRTDDRADPNRLRKIDGQWRSVFQRDIVREHVAAGGACAQCGATENLEAHHVIPVWKSPDRAFDAENATVLCGTCHDQEHRTQGWQGGTYLYGDLVTVDDVSFRGIEQTYDLEIAGAFPNFLANGVVVHNSRNSASSRAIPLAKQIEQANTNPAIPVEFPAEQRGMQGGDELPRQEREMALYIWHDALDDMLRHAKRLKDLGLHKSVAARLLEPFMWQTIIVSATAWDNFFSLRCSPLAQPEIRMAAEAMRNALAVEDPQPLQYGEWHLPFVTGYDIEQIKREHLHMGTTYDAIIDVAKRCSAARCARVSYLTHDTHRRDVAKDIALAERLMCPDDSGAIHASPFEHVATPVDPAQPVQGNFAHFAQWRHILEYTP